MQTSKERQGQDGLSANGIAKGNGENHPVMSRSSSDSATRGGNGIAEPTNAPDVLAAFMKQRVIDKQSDAARKFQSGQDKNANLFRQVGDFPGGAFKKVVIGIQVMALAMVGGRIRVSGFADAKKGLFTKAGDPTEKEEVAGDARGCGKNGRKDVDNGSQRVYHRPRG